MYVSYVLVVFMKNGNMFCSDGSVLRKMRVSLVFFLTVDYRADHGKCLPSAATRLGAALGTSEGVTLAYVPYAALDRLAVHEEHHSLKATRSSMSTIEGRFREIHKQLAVGGQK